MRRKLSTKLHLVWLALVLTVSGCGENNPLAPEVRGPNEIWIQGLEKPEFVPSRLVVDTGTTVKWINKDGDNHTIESGTPGNPTTAFPGSPLLETRNMSYSFTFNSRGTFPYFCSIHSDQGEVVVQ